MPKIFLTGIFLLEEGLAWHKAKNYLGKLIYLQCLVFSFRKMRVVSIYSNPFKYIFIKTSFKYFFVNPTQFLFFSVRLFLNFIVIVTIVTKIISPSLVMVAYKETSEIYVFISCMTNLVYSFSSLKVFSKFSWVFCYMVTW